MGLMPQDAYYHFYGDNLSWSYFDHPGMIGYILKSFTSILGKHIYVVKLADFIITSCTLYSFYKLALCFLSSERTKQALVILCSTFFISILSFNSTPDVPLLLFWTLSILFCYNAIFKNKKAYWIYAGIAMGLAFNSKYTAILLQIGLIAFVLFSSKHRKLFISPWFWLCIIISILVTFPVWWWNYQHDFASFVFQSSNRTGTISKFVLKPKYFFGALGHQLLLLLPFILIVFFKFSYQYISRFITKFKLPDSKILFLLAFFIPTFFGFLSLTPIYWVKLNWLMPSYVTGIIITAMFIPKKWIKYQVIFSIAIHILVAIQVVFYVAPIKSDDTWVGWEELSKKIEELQTTYPNTFVFSNDNYKTSAALNFFMKDKVFAQNIIGLPALHFDYLGDDLNKLNGKSALFIDSDKRFKNNNKLGNKVTPEIKQYFEKVTELEPIYVSFHGRIVRKFWVFYCENYNSTPKKGNVTN